MKNLSKFQLIFLGLFIFAIFLGVIVLALSRSASQKATLPRITIWGTLPQDQFAGLNAGVDSNNPDLVDATYIQKSPATMYQNLLEAIAAGTSPDAIIVPQNDLYHYRGKTAVIPYTVFNERTYLDTFIDGTDIFKSSQGITAIPFAVDPLVMYWNKDIFNATGNLKPPQTWDQMYNFAKTVTLRDQARNITRGAIALGEYGNIDHAEDILAALIYQAGGRITFTDNATGQLGVTLNNAFSNPQLPALSVVNFYTQFSDPQKETYTWNKTLPDSKSYFTSGDLALYIGYASEETEIRSKNPNLNFDVSPIPQAKGATVPTTHGAYWTYAILTSAPHATAAYTAIGKFAGIQAGQNVVNRTAFLPVRRDLLAVPQSRADATVFYNAAIQSRSWIDPNSAQSDLIFNDLINTVTSGRLTVPDAINRAAGQLGGLI